MDNIENAAPLVLKIANPNTVTVKITCQQFGDEDKVITKLPLKVTFEKTSREDWDLEAQDADASLEEKGIHILLRQKIKNIKGLPLERNGIAAEFDASAMDLVLKHQWIIDELWAALLAINGGKRSDAYRGQLLKN
ncbi:MAG TPA: hypothetical protein VIF37_06435 [Methylobacter sp.]|jgi:hypothetical protein